MTVIFEKLLHERVNEFIAMDLTPESITLERLQPLPALLTDLRLLRDYFHKENKPDLAAVASENYKKILRALSSVYAYLMKAATASYLDDRLRGFKDRYYPIMHWIYKTKGGGVDELPADTHLTDLLEMIRLWDPSLHARYTPPAVES